MTSTSPSRPDNCIEAHPVTEEGTLANESEDTTNTTDTTVVIPEKVPSTYNEQSTAGAAKVGESEFDFPDGGIRAWLVVLGIILSSNDRFGYVNSWGVFQSYYEQTLLRTHSASTIAWIGSVQYMMVFLPAVISGRLFDIGWFKIPYFAASVLCVVTTILVAECTQFWHFLLCQGFGVGLACGMLYGPTVGVIGHWFKRRRGLAMGLTAVGSSAGGTFFPIAARKLIPLVGFPWTLRILGFILIFVLVIPNITLARRLPAKNSQGGMFNPQVFKNLAFTVYAIASVMTFLGLYTVLTYIDISAIQVGVSEDFSFYLVSIANASSALGRIVAGLMVDRIGAINYIAPMTFFAGILTYAWPFAKSEGSLIAIAVIYGIMNGTFVSSFLFPLFELGPLADIGRRTGMVMTLSAFGVLCGLPISGAINRQTGGFEAVGLYGGSCVVSGVGLMVLTRYLALRSWWGRF
ncbi:MFS general substrate transporter [Dendrothele bispora CBS 962.96]|uniref:MFS general substrate transporter n=1 Tax=Dendrothele bispora (strain CBS 962.96) TaxID=1314807 RepID=A0A4S8LXU0_DENBC|nr:MFS general substrate transporter [Dendrothele bispora CBS 962.96]